MLQGPDGSRRRALRGRGASRHGRRHARLRWRGQLTRPRPSWRPQPRRRGRQSAAEHDPHGQALFDRRENRRRRASIQCSQRARRAAVFLGFGVCYAVQSPVADRAIFPSGLAGNCNQSPSSAPFLGGKFEKNGFMRQVEGPGFERREGAARDRLLAPRGFGSRSTAPAALEPQTRDGAVPSLGRTSAAPHQRTVRKCRKLCRPAEAGAAPRAAALISRQRPGSWGGCGNPNAR